MKMINVILAMGLGLITLGGVVEACGCCPTLARPSFPTQAKGG